LRFGGFSGKVVSLIDRSHFARSETISLSHDPGVLVTPVKEFDMLDMATAITRKLSLPLCRLWRQRGRGRMMDRKGFKEC
jgi:hypothetical protein